MYGMKYYFKDSGLLFLALLPKVWTTLRTKKADKYNRFSASLEKISMFKHSDATLNSFFLKTTLREV